MSSTIVTEERSMKSSLMDLVIHANLILESKEHNYLRCACGQRSVAIQAHRYIYTCTPHNSVVLPTCSTFAVV